MGRLRLGEFLIEKGLATPSDVVSALEIQAKRRTPLGDICIQEGVLRVADVLDILNEQVRTPHELFGEIAVSQGLLTAEQVHLAKRVQKIFSQPLGEILVEIGVIDRAELEAAVEEFKDRVRAGV